MFTRKLALAAMALGVLGFGQAAQAQGSLNLYCSVQNEWCQAIVTNFQRDTGIRVNMTQRGSGESLAAIRAEAQNPRGDTVYWVGPAGEAADAGPGTDFHAVAEGCVSVTPLQMDLTHFDQLERVRGWIAG